MVSVESLPAVTSHDASRDRAGSEAPETPAVSESDRTVLWLRGDHDVATVGGLSEWVTDAIAADTDDVVVDLSGVTFMDGSTVGVLVRAHDLLRTCSRSLVVRSPSRCARRVLDVCGLSGLVERTPALAVAPARGP